MQSSVQTDDFFAGSKKPCKFYLHEQQITQVCADKVKAVLGGYTESFVYFQKLYFLTYVYSVVHFLFWANRQHLNSS